MLRNNVKIIIFNNGIKRYYSKNGGEIIYNDNQFKDTKKRISNLSLPEIKSTLSINEKKKLTEFEKKELKIEKSKAKRLEAKRESISKDINSKKLELQSTLEQFENAPPEFKILFPKSLQDKFKLKLNQLDENKIEQNQLIKEFEKQQQQQQQQVKQQQQPLNESSQNEKNLKHLSLLFGKEVVEQQIKKPILNSNIGSVIEFSFQDKFYLGIVREVSPDNRTYQIERFITDNDYSNDDELIQQQQQQQPKTDIVYINKLDIINYWKNGGGGGEKIEIKDLIELEKEYKKKHFEFMNYISTKSVTSLFIQVFEFTSTEVSKLIYATSNPTKQQVYFTFKYLSTNSDIVKPKDGRLGFQFIESKKCLNSFINKINLFLIEKEKKKLSVQEKQVEEVEEDSTFYDVDFDKHLKELEEDNNNNTESDEITESFKEVDEEEDDDHFYIDQDESTITDKLTESNTISLQKNNELINWSIISNNNLDIKDIYYLNLLKIASLSPFNSFPSDEVFRKILKELNYDVSPEGSSKLLSDIGFLKKLDHHHHQEKASNREINYGLWTNELFEYIDKIIKKPNEIKDLLGDSRVEFNKELPVLAIDPQSTFAVDDAFSLDFSGELVDKLYMHIADVSRWMPDNKDNILYKSALVNLKTSYLPQGVFHMFPPSLIQAISLSNASSLNPAHAITVEMNFEKGTGKMISYQIYPTYLDSIVSLSQDQATKSILDSKDKPLDSLGIGQTILMQAYQLTSKRKEYRIKNKRDLEHYGRQGVNRTTIKINKPHIINTTDTSSSSDSSTDNVRLSKTTYSIGNEIIDEFLSSVDDVFTDYFEKNNAFGFYRYFGQADYQRVSKASSFLTATSPLRNFTHLFTQLQLSSLLLSTSSNSSKQTQPTFNWDYISSIGNDIVKTLQLKQSFQIKLTNYYLLKSIEKEILLQKSSNYKINSKDFKPILTGKILSIDYKNYQFSIHLLQFKYSTIATYQNNNHQNNNQSSSSSVYQSRTQLPFSVGDLVNVSVDDFDLKRSTLQLSFLKKLKNKK